MNRDEVMELVKSHLVTELELDPDLIKESARFKDDLDANSLDLYELLMELEDNFRISVSEQEAGEIKTVGDAVDFVVAKTGA